MSFFEAVDDFIEAEAENAARANARVKPEQILKPGDFCVRTAHGIRIYSEILDAAEHLRAGREPSAIDEEELDEIKDTRSIYQEDHMRFFRFTRSFSGVLPEGELGDIHLSTVGRKLTKDEFEAARKAGWL